jgi:hypothetical protein
MNFNPHRLAVIIWTKSGHAHQVKMTIGETEAVGNLISRMHGGTVKCRGAKLALSLTTPVKVKEAK